MRSARGDGSPDLVIVAIGANDFGQAKKGPALSSSGRREFLREAASISPTKPVLLCSPIADVPNDEAAPVLLAMAAAAEKEGAQWPLARG